MPPLVPTQRLLSLPSTLRPLLAPAVLAPGLLTRPITTNVNSNNSPPAPTNTSTIDATEISHFSALASSWWDARGPSRLLHLMNPLRHSFISSCLAAQPDSHETTRRLRYLDIGCGGGIFAESAARLQHTESVTGIDPSKEVLAVAIEHARRDPVLLRRHEEGARLRYLNCGVEELRTGDASAHTDGEGDAPASAEGEGYDIVTLFEVLEHVSDPSAFLDQVSRHVKPGGWLVLSTIARTWTSWATTKVMAEDVLRIVPRGTHEWAKYVNEREVRGWFEKRGGWTGARAMGVVYVPGLGWKEVKGGEEWGNYFFGVRRAVDS